MRIRKLEIMGVALFVALATGAIAAGSVAAATGEGWQVEGKPITTGEGALAAESKGSIELINSVESGSKTEGRIVNVTHQRENAIPLILLA